MSRIALPLAVADIAALARFLRSRLAQAESTPSHLEMLHWLAKAAGYKNFQHFRAEARLTGSVAPDDTAQPASVIPGVTARPQAVAPDDTVRPQAVATNGVARPAPVTPGDAARPETVALARPTREEAPPVPEVVDQARIKRLLRLFDAEGRLARWPSKRGLQLTCLWTLWAGIPAREVFNEPGITRLLAAAHGFGDPVLLRRELCDLGLLWRTTDCRAYKRLERRPPPDALELIRRVRAVATARPDTAPRPAPGKEGRHVR
ncbi:MAG: DUF2087 domain-containing protein [Solidesulfovibrio sp. DCME]|uniref:DUF2087 domain-containing protein n=1 Tax=Solidesulfovibrio sp. DCME TaxID=3447380 RepID=UPI003D0D8FE4